MCRPSQRVRNAVRDEESPSSSTSTPDAVHQVPQGVGRVALGPISGAGPEPGAKVGPRWIQLDMYREIMYVYTHEFNRT